jgi:hypothetical protein
VKFKLEFSCDSDAFAVDFRYEISAVLNDVGNRVERTGENSGVVRDANGNTIGVWVIDSEDDSLTNPDLVTHVLKDGNYFNERE